MPHVPGSHAAHRIQTSKIDGGRVPLDELMPLPTR
jgi:hypothetical protein